MLKLFNSWRRGKLINISRIVSCVIYPTPQHEYQHQQEFGHDAAAKDDGRDVKQRTKVTLAEHTAGALKGTGHRGRKVAVAADKRRAKRAQEMIGDQEHLDGRVQDVREAQRVRWVTHMQQKQGRPTGAIEGSNRGQGKEVRSRATAIGKGQARPSQQSRPLSTTTAIPSPSIRRCDNRPEGSFIAVGEATSVVADTKQVCSRAVSVLGDTGFGCRDFGDGEIAQGYNSRGDYTDGKLALRFYAVSLSSNVLVASRVTKQLP